jgi:hypothetical protein
MMDIESTLQSFAKTIMSALSRALFLSLVAALTLDAACAGEDGISLGGFICARPFTPDCVDQPDTYRTEGRVLACQLEIQRFAVASAAYRDCLERQISSAMRHANDVLDHFHCLSKQASCPAPVKPP